MGGERQGPKGGRYVGGFLQLFDWNAKSRKKLFSSIPEHPKQGKKSVGNSTTRIRMVDEDGIGATASIKGSSDYSCASSVTDEEGCGSRAPGVVARLMGLDSLPTSNVVEPYCSPLSETQSLQEAPFSREDLHFYQEHQIMHSGNFLEKSEGLRRNIMEPKHQKLLSRPLEKFQTEILPPKSAKSIPITHHKLLSPIKNPRFIPSKDAAHIMEAAAKIIDPGPQANVRTKISSAGSSSVPLKVRELKEKMEASQRLSRFADVSNRTLDSNGARSLKGQSLNKSWNGSVGTSLKASHRTDGSSACTKNKGKSVSLAIQAKVNVQRREGLNPSGKNMEGMQEDEAFEPTQSSKSEPSSHKIVHKKSSVRTASMVLRQNNQKQNCNLAKENLPSKSLATNSHGRKVVSGESSHGRQRNLYKDAGSSRVGSKKSSLEGRDGHKYVSHSVARNVPRKKRSIDGSLQDERNDTADSMLIGKNGKLSQSSSVADRHFPWADECRKKGTDVVSFTFTTPIMRSMGSLELTKQLAEASNSLFADNRSKKVMLCPDNMKLSPLGYNTGSDSLSVLLEQKLRELTNGIEPSKPNFIKAEASSASTRQNSITFCAGSETERLHDKNAPLELQTGNMHGGIFSSYSSTEPEVPRRRYDLQGGEIDGCSSNKVESRQFYNCLLPSPVSVLDTSASTESCNSSDSTGSNMTEECKQQCSSVLVQEVINLGNPGKTQQLETEMDLSDSASSLSTGTIGTKGESGFKGETHQLETEMDLSDSASSLSAGTIGTKGESGFKGEVSETSADWELDYVKDILCNVELMFNECASGRTHEIINPRLFDQLERKRGSLSICRDEISVERKALFVSVSECLEWRCQQFVGGGCRAWAKGVALVRRKERLAEEVYKEIQGWRSMRDCMVDELVDKDMSVQQGRWLDFQADEFELAVDIEAQIFDSLIFEVAADVLPFNLSNHAAFLMKM